VAKKQLERALPTLIKRQNNDGSWGRKEHETETFLVVDALKNAATVRQMESKLVCSGG
jgi:hypothetical protein